MHSIINLRQLSAALTHPISVYIVLGLIVVGIGFSILRVIEIMPSPVNSVTPPDQTQTNQLDVSIEPLSKVHLFGESQNDVRMHIPQTTLSLALVGLIHADVLSQSSAIISINGNRQANIYQEGEQIIDGVIIKQISTHQVILERHGRDEILSLPSFINE